MANAVATRTEKINDAIDKQLAGRLQINRQAGGLDFTSMSEVMEFAKLLSVSQQAVPPHCRGQVGVCLGITIQAIEWRMSPYAVASKSYVVNDRLGYESQLVHAVIEQRAPIQGRLRHEFAGTGDKRTCRVWATPRGESEPLSYTSQETGKIKPKNSPLWTSKPDLQLYYNTSRDWARMYFPDVILGVYADDELEGSIIEQGGHQLAGIDGLKQRLALQLEKQNSEAEESADGIDDTDEPESEESSEQATAPDSVVQEYHRQLNEARWEPKKLTAISKAAAADESLTDADKLAIESRAADLASAK